MLYMHSIFRHLVLSSNSTGQVLPPAIATCSASPMLGRFVALYCDDILIL
jgi:hypothetical protein